MTHAGESRSVSEMAEQLTSFIRRRGDATLALGLVLLLLGQIWATGEPVADRLAASAGTVALLVPLALRVRFPLVLPTLLIALFLAGSMLPKHLGDLEAAGFIVLLAVYSAAAHTAGWRMLAGAALTVAMGVGAAATDPDALNLSAVLFFSLLFGAPWLAGRVVRRRRLNERRLEREKEKAEAAIVEERGRIARELHDVVAHAISVIVLQARGGRRLLDTDPRETRSALDTIERTGQQALGEMRRLVGLLRESDEQLALAPQPSLTRLDALAEQVRAAGLPVEIAVEGEPVELPPGVDLSAYRIVQEALTNALKHAGPARALVRVRYAPGELELEITDDGAGTGEGGGSGQGLVGMRERVAVFGGNLEAGMAPEGGYALRARLPIASAHG
jgi:signal transduction histidine kinase